MSSIIVRRATRSALAFVALLFGCAGATTSGERPVTPSPPLLQFAPDYPSRAIRLIVPYSAGGGADVWGRFVAARLAPLLGQSFQVVNAPGMGGNVGTELASKADPDGYTLLFGSTGPLVVHAFTYNRLPFDSDKDFVPIGLFESSPLLLVVHRDVHASSFTELMTLARSERGAVTFGTEGNGSPEQIAGELFERLTNLQLRDVPYGGAGPARESLSRGNVTMMFDLSKAAMANIRSGKQRPLAVADTRRSDRLPEVPTLQELGYPELEMRIWTGLFAPRGTPSNVIAKVNAALRKILDDADVRQAIHNVGGDPMPTTPEEVASFLTTERIHWKRLVKDAGVSRVDGPL
jgi:tripartite-type tricarboxylate transporter receptor subunit TctC